MAAEQDKKLDNKDENELDLETIQNDLSGLLSNQTILSDPLKLNSYDELQTLLLEQSQRSQAALEDIEKIESNDLFTENTQASLTKLSDHISKAFEQVDQLEQLINFVDNKANALDAKMAALEKEQNAWLKENQETGTH